MPDFESENTILENKKNRGIYAVKKVEKGAEGAVETTPSAAIP